MSTMGRETALQDKVMRQWQLLWGKPQTLKSPIKRDRLGRGAWKEEQIMWKKQDGTTIERQR